MLNWMTSSATHLRLSPPPPPPPLPPSHSISLPRPPPSPLPPLHHHHYKIIRKQIMEEEGRLAKRWRSTQSRAPCLVSRSSSLLSLGSLLLFPFFPSLLPFHLFVLLPYTSFLPSRIDLGQYSSCLGPNGRMQWRRISEHGTKSTRAKPPPKGRRPSSTWALFASIAPHWIDFPLRITCLYW